MRLKGPHFCLDPLTRRRDFAALRRGKFWASPLFKIRFVRQAAGSVADVYARQESTLAEEPTTNWHMQCAFVVSKRFSKKAVVRNRARRRLREALKTALADKTQTSHQKTDGPACETLHTFLLLVRPETSVLKVAFQDLVTSFAAALHMMRRRQLQAEQGRKTTTPSA